MGGGWIPTIVSYYLVIAFKRDNENENAVHVNRYLSFHLCFHSQLVYKGALVFIQKQVNPAFLSTHPLPLLNLNTTI